MPRTCVWIASVTIALMSIGLSTTDADAQCPCNADFFPDGIINIMDLAQFALFYEDGDLAGDINCDGAVNMVDVAYLACQMGGAPNPACCGQVTGVCCREDETCATTVAAQCAGTFIPDATCSAVPVDIVEPGGVIVTHNVWTSAECTGGGLAAGGLAAVRAPCQSGVPFRDSWVTPASNPICHNWGVPGSPVIPADFFEPGSDPFTGTVCMRGEPLGIPELGNADTVIERAVDPFDRCEMPGGGPRTVQIEIVALSLVSIGPITVTGASGTTLWDVAVDLSEVPSPPGHLTATKTHCAGGTYTSLLNVQPRFTFTKVGDPSQVRVLDTGLEAIPPVPLPQVVPKEWVSDIALTHSAIDPCTDFHPGIADETDLGPITTTACDCNGNGVRDLCDFEMGIVGDCNQNLVPDNCDIASGFSRDDNGDTIPDECDPTGVPTEPTLDVSRPELNPASPNPLATTTTLRYRLPAAGAATLSIYDVTGRHVITLADKMSPRGPHSLDWDGRDERGNLVPAGVYHVRLTTAAHVLVSKVVVVR